MIVARCVLDTRYPKIRPILTNTNPSLWYDSAGPVYYNQVKGLLGYGMPTSQLIFGTVSAAIGLLSTSGIGF